MLSHHISRGPGCLQIEAAGDGINVEHFAGIVKDFVSKEE